MQLLASCEASQTTAGLRFKEELTESGAHDSSLQTSMMGRTAADGLKDFSSASAGVSKSFPLSCTRASFILSNVSLPVFLSFLPGFVLVLPWFGFCPLCVCSRGVQCLRVELSSALVVEFVCIQSLLLPNDPSAAVAPRAIELNVKREDEFM